MMSWLYYFLSKRYQAVSFDVFDTLIERVGVKHPHDVFTLVGKEVLGEGDAFRRLRVRALAVS
jgi:hypothetical protein